MKRPNMVMTEEQGEALQAAFDKLWRAHPPIRRLKNAELNAVIRKLADELFEHDAPLIVDC
jgi:hypothetical protein